MTQLLAPTSRPGPLGARVAFTQSASVNPVVVATTATTHEVKNTRPAGARSLAVLEGPNRRGWGLIGAFWRRGAS